MSLSLNGIASIAYNSMQLYYERIGRDEHCATWNDLPEDSQVWFETTIKSLTDKAKGNDIGMMGLFFHNAMASRMLRDGWRHGEIHNEEEKTTPYMVPFEELSKEDQSARFLFCAVLSALQSAR
jgi:hypothetical protein